MPSQKQEPNSHLFFFLIYIYICRKINDIYIALTPHLSSNTPAWWRFSKILIIPSLLKTDKQIGVVFCFCCSSAAPHRSLCPCILMSSFEPFVHHRFFCFSTRHLTNDLINEGRNLNFFSLYTRNNIPT